MRPRHGEAARLTLAAAGYAVAWSHSVPKPVRTRRTSPVHWLEPLSGHRGRNERTAAMRPATWPCMAAHMDKVALAAQAAIHRERVRQACQRRRSGGRQGADDMGRARIRIAAQAGGDLLR